MSKRGFDLARRAVARTGALLLAAAPLCAVVACGDDTDSGAADSAGESGTGTAGNSSGNSSGGGDAGQPSGGSAVGGDPGASGAAAGEAAGGQPTTCGDGVIEGAECEPPSTSLCSDDCVEIATSACYDCEQASACYEFSENCLVFEGAERTLCYDVHECVNATGCGDGDSTLTSCFCGELTTSECIDAPSSGPGSPSGPCAEPIRGSMGEDATNSQVLTRYMQVAYPGGGAIARMTCDKVVPECLEVCGF